MKVLGLTGGIGSGKTTVANFFRDLDIPVYIADAEAKELMKTNPQIRQRIISILGTSAYKGEQPDREYIAGQVFSDKGKLEALNSIIHPAVERDFDHWKAQQNSPYVVYEAAILFETGRYKKCDKNLLVVAPYEERISRVMKRDRATLEQIEARMNNQWPDEKKRKLADFLIENTLISETQKAVVELHRIMLESA